MKAALYMTGGWLRGKLFTIGRGRDATEGFTEGNEANEGKRGER
jgi:hypothetical protein